MNAVAEVLDWFALNALFLALNRLLLIPALTDMKLVGFPIESNMDLNSATSSSDDMAFNSSLNVVVSIFMSWQKACRPKKVEKNMLPINVKK